MTGGDGMQTVEGKSVLNQVVFGKLKFCRLAPKEPKPRPALCTEEEAERFFRAQKQSVLELNELHDRTCRQIGEETASIFAIHAMLLEDEDFIGTVCRMIREKGTCAEYAVWETGRQLASTFSTMDNLYMQARAVDFRDITYRIVWRLRGERLLDPLRAGPAILVSDEFLPSEVIELDRSRLVGILAREGSVDSHTALLLRAFRIPAMAEVDLDEQWDGHTALLDGIHHRLYLDPDSETLRRLLPERNQALAGCV